MPASQTAATERRNERVMISHEPPKLKTTLKIPPKQATNPLQFVKVGPCSLYRTAQEQLQKVQEVKKIKQEVRDDPEDWQSNLDNWKSSRRKRQEHIIERVVEVKKLELEEHDRQRRRSKTFSEMMEERGNRGRKLSISLAMYHEEDANDLSDLGIGTSSGKSSVSGDTHDDAHSVLSDRDSEIEKNHSDVDNVAGDTGDNMNNNASRSSTEMTTTTTTTTMMTTTTTATNTTKKPFGNSFHGHNHNQEYDSATTATASSPEPEEYTYEGAIRGYVSRVSQNIPRRSLVGLDVVKLDNVKSSSSNLSKIGSLNEDNKVTGTLGTTTTTTTTTTTVTPVVKVDILKRREIFEKGTQKCSDQKSINNNNNNNSNNNNNNNNINRLSGDFTSTKSIKERLSNLEKQKIETDNNDKVSNNKILNNRLSGDMSSIRERLSHLEKQTLERDNTKITPNSSNNHKTIVNTDELENVRPIRERLSTLEKYSSSDESSAPPPTPTTTTTQHHDSRHVNGELFTGRTIKDRLNAFDVIRSKESSDKRGGTIVKQHSTSLCFRDQENRIDTSTPSERSSSPDSEYRAPRGAPFHRSLDSLDADASSGPDTFERVQSLEEFDYGSRRYHHHPAASSSSAELLNDTDREDSGIHTADVSCSVSQADEPVDEEIVHATTIIEEKPEDLRTIEANSCSISSSIQDNVIVKTKSSIVANESTTTVTNQQETAIATKEPIIFMEKENDEENKNNVETICQTTTTTTTSNSNSTTMTDREIGEPIENLSINTILETTMTNPTITTTTTNIITKNSTEVMTMDTPDSPTSPIPIIIGLERPTTLNFNKTEISNIDVNNYLSPVSPQQFLPLSLSNDEEIVTGLAFPLGPPTTVEPPKEKPPPPPVDDISDEETLPMEPLKRLNSTRRIKKELRTRRSDFLGIEGVNDDDLERELTLMKPPDMAAILAEERRIEQLHRRSYDTDSNYEQDSSHERDSGVELGHVEDWTKQPVSPDMSQHSRQSSEPFGASVTSSEEDEITKKEREIIEVLEKEEQWRYGNNHERNSDLGEKLAHKLRELEEEKMQLERERAQEVVLRRQEENLRKNEDNVLRKQEETLRKQQQQQQQQQQQHLSYHHHHHHHHRHHHQDDEIRQQQEAAAAAAAAARIEIETKRVEVTRQEEEQRRIQAEQQLRIQNEIEEKERRTTTDVRRKEEIRIRAMENQIREQENKILVGAGLNNHEDEFASGEVLRVERELLQLEQEELKRQRNNLAYREQKQLKLAEQLQEQWKSLQDVAHHHGSSNISQQYKHQPAINYRSSMPNLQLQDAQRRRPPPPPIPSNKPLRHVEQRQRDVTIRNSRVPSADSIPQQVDASLRHSSSATTLSCHGGQQMTRQTLQALSAAPRPRIVQGDQWVQRRKSDVPRGVHDFNYQHWLIQEAEQRRIHEKNQRSPARKSQPHVTGTSVPYAAAPTRSDSKPLPDSIIQTLTQRVQNRAQEKPLSPRRRLEHSTSQEHIPLQHSNTNQQQLTLQPKSQQPQSVNNNDNQEKMLSVSGKKKCSHCGDELGRGAAMIIESLRLFYHMECFKCCVCHVRLGDGLMGTDVRVRNHKLHCHNCYSSDDGVKFSCV
ncbi:PREDICTED: calponin homology domain-containing protein DDB_G0272472 isoform X3 [Polistes canadensis]|uniref:calponin homology domain-containing protein DDB_G0272472 isoform X3 n=1 Tax=Polistes canadensis TaxID=91411 RepID=UPI000718B421|nr:PREDICTED: calponin homology domain-containing protein DDB_G0272472 isoform X3 [Polistes canadensis]